MSSPAPGTGGRPTLLLALFLIFSIPATVALAGHEASLPGSDLEIDADANLTVDEDPNPTTLRSSLDWDNVDQLRKGDTPSGQSDDAFGQGTKEDTAVPSVVSGSIPPNKSDLLEFGVYQERSDDGNFLHLYWTRVQDPSGTTNMDFEFNQSTELSDNGVTPPRTVGDLLLTYDLEKGGTDPVLSLRTWDGSAWGPGMDLSAAALASGSINSSVITFPDSDGIGTLDPRTFGEATIDLSIIFDPSQCQSFGGAYLKSRSSTSFSAAIKDFIAPVPANISNCGVIQIQKRDDAGAPLAGATFTLFEDNPPLAADQQDPAPGPEDTETDESCTTNELGQCSMVNILSGTYWVVETATPAGHDTADPQPIDMGADDVISLDFVDPRQPATVVIHKEDDAGTPLAGATFTLFSDVGQVGVFEDGTDPATGTSCTTQPDGTCTMLNILPPGDYCVVETTAPTGHDPASPQCLTLGLADSVTLTFVDPRQAATITITKTDDAGAALAGATFALFSDGGLVGTYEAGVDSPTGFGCTTTDAGTCSIADILPPGNYCVVETVTPTGHDTADPQCLDLALNQTVGLTFVDVRQPATIGIVKTAKSYAEGGPVPLAGATFTLFADAGTQGTYEPGTDTATEFSCTTAADGTCSMENILPTGQYCVVETTTPEGYDGGAAQCLAVSLAQSSTLSFTNDPLSALTLTFHSLGGDGVTAATSVICEGPDISGELGSLGHEDSHTLTNLREGAYTCTIVVDP